MKLFDIKTKSDEKSESDVISVNDGNSVVEDSVMEVKDAECKVENVNKDDGNKSNNELFEKIKNIALRDSIVISKEKYFSSKGKTTVIMNRSSLKPSNFVLISGSRFKERYLSELERDMFSEKINEEKMMEVIYLVSKIKNGKYPIGVKFNGFSKLEKSIIEVLNKFFNSHFRTLCMMYGMLDSELDKRSKMIENTSEAKTENAENSVQN